jgi:hypothetical protein
MSGEYVPAAAARRARVLCSERTINACITRRVDVIATPCSGALLASMNLLYGPTAADPLPASPPPWLARSASTAE